MNAGPIGGAIGVTREQWKSVNSVGESPVMLNEDHGTGQYLASLDVFHQLHCVVNNLCGLSTRRFAQISMLILRRIFYARTFTANITTNMKVVLLVHQKLSWLGISVNQIPFPRLHSPDLYTHCSPEHCVETLRQTLMCHGDISLLTYNWVEGREMPYPNFNTIHTCKKWDTLVEWNMKRDVSKEWRDGRSQELAIPMKPEHIAGLKVPP